MKELVEKLEGDIMKGHLIHLGLCIVALYYSITISEIERPSNEVAKLLNYIETYNKNPEEYSHKLRRSVFDSISERSKSNITNFFRKYKKVKLNWNEYQIKPVKSATGKYNFNKLAIDSSFHILASKSIIVYPKVIYNECKYLENNGNRNLINKDGSIMQYSDIDYFFHNVSSFSMDKNNFTINVEVGRTSRLQSEHNRLNGIIFGQSYKIECPCKQDSVYLEALDKDKWREKEFPWFSENWESVKLKEVSAFNELWRNKLLKDGISQINFDVLGIKGQGSSVCYIILIFSFGIYLYYLSGIYKIMDIVKHSDVYYLSIYLFYNNIWSKLLTIITLIVLPAASILLIFLYVINKFYVIFLFIYVIIVGSLLLYKLRSLYDKG